MKKLLIILLSCVALTVYGQKPKVAIYITGKDPLNEIVANRLLSCFIASGKYTAVERSTAFLEALAKEHHYERSGEVDDADIAKLGKQFGVQYVCVISVKAVAYSEKYISARIIDVNSAEVIGSCSSNGTVLETNSKILMEALDNLSNKFIRTLDYAKDANAKKVAVYIAKTGKEYVDMILGDQLVDVFAGSGKYIAVERTNEFLKQLNSEAGYQASGAVDDDDMLMRLGKQFGVQYVCVAKAIAHNKTYFVTSRLVDVTTAEVVKLYNAENKNMNNASEVVAVAREVAYNLAANTPSTLPAHQNYTEDAFGLNMKMIWVEGGSFMMGCTKEQGKGEKDEKKVHRVTLEGYYIGMLEVTQAQWATVMLTNSSSTKGANLPIENIRRSDAVEFCRLLSIITGRTYDLPTEAQWEYAARGGIKNDGTKYAGSDIIEEVAWCNADGSDHRIHPCGTKRPNGLGIYDMSGNVVEYCKDNYLPYYGKEDAYNPLITSFYKGNTYYVLRGGSHYSPATNCRVANRYYVSPSHQLIGGFGFRVVCIP